MEDTTSSLYWSGSFGHCFHHVGLLYLLLVSKKYLQWGNEFGPATTGRTKSVRGEEQSSTSTTVQHQQQQRQFSSQSASYPPLVPGASEGELFGEVHTQYAQSVSSATS